MRIPLRIFATVFLLLFAASLALAEDITQERGRFPKNMVVTVVDEGGNSIEGVEISITFEPETFYGTKIP